MIRGHTSLIFCTIPVTDNNFTLKATEIITAIEIINMIGQTIYIQENSAIRGDMHIQLEDDIDNGMYLIRIKLADNQTVIKKLLVK